MNWLRLYHGTHSDTKWPIIARKAGTNVLTVVGVWVALLEYASQHDPRGSIEGFDPETEDAAYGIDDGTCAAVLAVMKEKGLIINDIIVSWERRQPETSTERMRKSRAKKTPSQAPHHAAHVTPCDETCAAVTKCDAHEKNVTIRTEQNREEQNRDFDPKVKRCIPLTGYVSSASPEDATPSAEVIPKLPLSQARKTPECPHERIIALYHELLPEMTPVKVWNEARAKMLRTRWREDPTRQNLDWWRDYFLLVRASDFLMGKRPPKAGGVPFMADLEWIIRPNNMVKILEGRYSNSPRARPMDVFDRAIAQGYDGVETGNLFGGDVIDIDAEEAT